MEYRFGQCKESYKIKGRGIVIYLQHNLNGLEKGTLLNSETSNLQWQVESRILFLHATEIHRVFENETYTTAHTAFKDDESRTRSQLKLKNEEISRIFQYMVKPIDHDIAPRDGEKLLITKY